METIKKNLPMCIVIMTSFLLGMLLDHCIRSYPLLKLDTEINILDAATLLFTIIISFMIPFFVTKLIEDTQGIKKFLVDEVKELITILDSIKKVISDSYSKEVYDQTSDRDSILNKINEAELKVDCILKQIDVAFPKKAKQSKSILTDLLFNFEDSLTGGELMHSNFNKVDDRFYKKIISDYSTIETGLKTYIQKIFTY